MLRSIGAVLAGFVVMAIVVMAGTVPLAAILMRGGMQGMRSAEPGRVVPSGYLAANLVLSLVGAAIGGYITVTLAGNAPWIHSAALAAFVCVMGIASARQAGGRGNYAGQPTWYPWTIPLVGMVGVLLGGMLH